MNGRGVNGLRIQHSVDADDAAENEYNLYANAYGDIDTDVGTYQYQTWVTEKVIYDKDAGTVAYYYDGTLIGTYATAAITSWDSVGLELTYGERDGRIAIDNIRMSTAPTPPSGTLVIVR